MAASYTIRAVERHEGSPRAGMDQGWTEWQVREGRKVLHRAGDLAAAARWAAAHDPRPAGGERDRVTRCVDLILLDKAEVKAGFEDGLNDPEMEPGPNRSRAYWHGWHNSRPWRSAEVHPQVALVADCRAVLGDSFMAILGDRV